MGGLANHTFVLFTDKQGGLFTDQDGKQRYAGTIYIQDNDAYMTPYMDPECTVKIEFHGTKELIQYWKFLEWKFYRPEASSAQGSATDASVTMHLDLLSFHTLKDTLWFSCRTKMYCPM